MNAIDRYMQMGKEFISKIFGKTNAYGGDKPRATSAPDEISGGRTRPDATRKPDPPSVPPRP